MNEALAMDVLDLLGWKGKPEFLKPAKESQGFYQLRGPSGEKIPTETCRVVRREANKRGTMKVKAPFRIDIHKPEWAIRAKKKAPKIACFCVLMGNTYFHDEILYTLGGPLDPARLAAARKVARP